MTQLAERATKWAQKRHSRRGFLATCGKVALGLGAVLAGLGGGVRLAHAACCSGTPCGPTCPPTPGGATQCPPGCRQTGFSDCCDTATSSWHRCFECLDCPGLPSPCECEYNWYTPC